MRSVLYRVVRRFNSGTFLPRRVLSGSRGEMPMFQEHGQIFPAERARAAKGAGKMSAWLEIERGVAKPSAVGFEPGPRAQYYRQSCISIS